MFDELIKELLKPAKGEKDRRAGLSENANQVGRGHR